MSILRQPAAATHERFLIVRTMSARCSAGTRVAFTNRWHQLILPAAGALIVETSAGAWTTAARNGVWVPAGVRHELETCGQVTLRNLYLRPTAVRGLPDECCVVPVTPLLHELAARVAQVDMLDRRVGWQRSLLELVAHEIRAAAKKPLELVWPADPRAARIARLVQEDPARPQGLAALCRGQRVSARTVQRLFPLETGLTFAQWRARLRFHHAARLLGEGRSVTQTALDCGYQSTSAFVVAFRRLSGETPGQFGGGSNAPSKSRKR